MRIFAAISTFARTESGAVTVDWVVLTAALVGLGLAVTNTVSNGLEDLSNEIRTQLERDHIVESFN
ncbi:MAG: pilus assembly protein [Rhodobacteraceae bacterium CG17_big_fil_post_rev_8_21_14_2_50_65_11]|nr:MAG: pilus assembly protein [Rhodobacteraceae bacterium CG17_big_fil_post_rev_8_21_14_2_50_65_11]